MSDRVPAYPEDMPTEYRARWRAYWKEEGLNWHPVRDLQTVIRLFKAYELYDNSNKALDTFVRLSSELRQLEDRMGLNVKARKDPNAKAETKLVALEDI